MPLKNIGKTLIKINKKSKTVKLSFDDNSSLDIHKDTLEMFPLYVGKLVSKEELKEITVFSNKTTLMEYALNLIKKGHYSENRMMKKLKNKLDDEKSIKYVINKLKSFDLLNDLAYIEELCCYYDEVLYGQNKIISKLYSLDFNQKDIEKIKFPISLEKEKAILLIEKLDRKFDNLPYLAKKKKIYSYLKSNGFINEVIKETISNLDKNIDEEQEYKKVDIELEKQMIRFTNKYHGRDLKEKIFKKLISKGFSLNIISKIWREKYE